MKKLLIMAIALVTIHATAQDRKDKKNKFSDFSTEEIATLKTKKLTLHLDLTEAQQLEVKSLILKEVEHREALKNQRQENKEKDNKPSKEERYATVNEKLDREIELKAQMKRILSEDQFEKWEALKVKRNRRQKHKG